MANGGVLNVDVKANIANFANNLKRASSEASDFANKLQTAVGKNDPFVSMRENAARVGRDFKQIVQGIILAQTFYQGIQAFKNLTAAVYEYTDSLNYAKTTFANLFSDTDLAEEFIAVLQDYAARSPFDFTDVENAAMQLKAYGIEAKNLMYVMEGLGNLAAVTGKPETFERVARAIGQINAKGKLMGEEMRQLAEAGLDVSKVYDKLGIQAGDVGKAGIDSATALNAIVETLNESYGGALKAANTTMRGLLANAKDVALMITSSIFQPMYDTIRRGVYTVEIELDKFRNLFTEGGLGYAIESYFGSGALAKFSTFISVLSSIGSTIYQLVAPALQLLSIYGEALLTVLMQLHVIISPLVTAFVMVYNTLMSTAQGARFVQGIMYGLAAAFIATKVASLGMMVLSVVSKVVSAASLVMTAAQVALLTATEAAGGAAKRAAIAWTAFAASLNINPVVLAIAIIGTLIAMLLGLKKVLGMAGEASAQFGVDSTKISDWLKNVKQGFGDINKFNKPFDTDNIEDAEEDLEDVAGATDKVKKAQEGLLSFDEVFKLPEVADPNATPKVNKDDLEDLEDVAAALDAIKDFELPDLEPLDFSELIPDLPTLDNLLEKFKEFLRGLDFGDIGAIIGSGLYTGIKAIEGFPKNIKEAISKWKPKEWFDDFKAKFKVRVEEAFEHLRELPTRIKEFPKRLSEAIAKWPETTRAALESFKTKFKIKVDETFEPLREAPKHVKEFPTKVSETIGKWPESMRVALDGFKLKFKLQMDGVFESIREVPKAIQEWPTKIAKSIAEWPASIAKSISSFKESFTRNIKEAFTGIKELPTTLKEFPKTLGKSIKTWIDDIAVYLGVFKLDLKENLLQAVKGGTEIEGDSVIKVFGERLKGIFSSGRILEFIKFGIKDMGLTTIGTFLFEQLANSIREDDPALANLAEHFGIYISSAISALILTKNPFAALGAVVITGIFEAIGDSFETGDWSTSIGEITSGLSLVLGKFLGRGFNPLAIVGVIGEMLVHGLAEWFRGNGDNEMAEVTDEWGNVLGSTLGMAGIGGVIGSIIPGVGTAIGGAIGAALGFLYGIVTQFGDHISNWWNNTAWPWLSGLPGRFTTWLGETKEVAKKQLHDNIYVPITNLGSTIASWWTDTAWPWITSIPSKIGKWFEDTFLGGTISPTGEKTRLALIDAFGNTKPLEWLKEHGGKIIEGLKTAITTKFEEVKTWFTELPSKIPGFVGDGLKTLAGFGGNVVSGIKSGAEGAWSSVTTWAGGVASGIKDKVGTGIETLKTFGSNVAGGIKSGAEANWNNVTTWASGIAGTIKDKVGKGTDVLTTFGTNAISGIKTSGATAFNHVQTWIASLASSIQKAAGSGLTVLQNFGSSLINGLKSGMSSVWSSVTSWIQSAISGITGAFSSAGSWLSSAGSSLITGFRNGLSSAWSTVTSWISGAISNITNVFNSAGSWLQGAGIAIIGGLTTGLNQGLSNLWSVLSNIWNSISGYFSNAGRMLYNAGWSIISGLWSGMVENFNNLLREISGWGSVIASYKGPEEYDKQLLVKPGQWIVQGLDKGMTEQFASVLDTVKSFGPAMQDAFAMTNLTPQILPSAMGALQSQIPVALQTSMGSATSGIINGMSALQNGQNQMLVSMQNNDRPVLQVGTLVASQQALRDLKRELDILELQKR